MYGFSGRSNKNSYKGNYTTSQPSIIEYIQNPNIQYPAKFYFFEDMKGTWNDITLYIDGISESQSAMDTLRNAYKKGKEVFPDSEKLYIGKAIVGSKDGYGIYLDDHSRYGVKLYNKDTKDEIGFFYTLPEIIASMDLIKE